MERNSIPKIPDPYRHPRVSRDLLLKHGIKKVCNVKVKDVRETRYKKVYKDAFWKLQVGNYRFYPFKLKAILILVALN